MCEKSGREMNNNKMAINYRKQTPKIPLTLTIPMIFIILSFSY